MENNLAISLLALDKKKNLDKFLSILESERIKLIELPILKIFKNYEFKKYKFLNFKKKLNKYSIKICSLQSLFYGKENLNIFIREDSQKILNHLKKVIKIAQFFGATNLIFGSPKNRVISAKNKQHQLKIALRLFKKIGNLCKKNKVYFLIEPTAKYYGCNYINNIRQGLRLIRYVNSDNFLINVDTGNIFLESENLYNYKKKNKFFKNFQISEKNLDDIRLTKCNHAKILKKFKTSNSIISLEMINQKVSNLRSQIKKFKGIVKEI
jgi:sugar phosphate isomerase/epimerase